MKSGSNPPSTISELSSATTYLDADYFPSTLKRADHELLALVLLPVEKSRLSFLSMTPETRLEVIGRLEEDEAKCWNLVRSVLGDRSIPEAFFQNGAYDISFLLRAYGIKTLNCAEDTMLLSPLSSPKVLKASGISNIYSDEGAWKHMRKKDETIKRSLI